MVRISRLSDYGVQMLAALARRPGEGLSSRGVAEAADIPEPTVRKLLKALSKAQLLISRRGVQGGYWLARPPEEISVAEIIAAIEGPIALTECNVPGDNRCERKSCPMRGSWQAINQLIQGTLSHLSLSQMVAQAVPTQTPSGGHP